MIEQKGRVGAFDFPGAWYINNIEEKREGKYVSVKLFCKSDGRGRHSFYLQAENEVYFLFCQDYRRSNEEYFGRGVLLSDGLDFSGVRNYAVRKTVEKLRIYVRYAEKEYGIAVLNKTKKREERERKRRNNGEKRGGAV